MTNVAPDLCVAVYRNLREGRLQPARYLHRRLVPLATLLEREHPAALKFALALLGFIEPATRLPIAPLDAAAKAEVADAMSCLADEYLAAAQ
ncbi:4-hydroxy-tetrahydrodipicolinate synthase [Bradyrhizobium ivorense]|uniref:4-hydroxy-tetrahydrodipicolinate synthase n=2 Tax=Bradyrhizobium ivorense TaxID=2511166 RepID=A0A508TVF8_9BRAD|nr:4-hydroxy-tetrahydrodipicolinate synthase [Bradyrhizobium ivorense]